MKNPVVILAFYIAFIILIIALIALVINGTETPMNFSDFTSLLLILMLFSSVLFVITRIDFANKSKKEVKKKYPQLSIVGIMRDRKSNETLRNVGILFLPLLGYL